MVKAKNRCSHFPDGKDSLFLPRQYQLFKADCGQTCIAAYIVEEGA